MFSLVGDPYPNLHLLSPWLDHQLVWFSEKHSCLFLRAAIDEHHWTCSLGFHSALSEYSVCPSQVNYILTHNAHIHIRYCGVLDMSTSHLSKITLFLPHSCPSLYHLFFTSSSPLLHPLRCNGPEGFHSSGVYSGLLNRKTGFSGSDKVGHGKSCLLVN